MSFWLKAVLQYRSVCPRRPSILSLLCSSCARYLQYSPDTLSLQLPATHSAYISPLDENSLGSRFVYENFLNDPSGSVNCTLSQEPKDTTSPQDFRCGLLSNHSDSTCEFPSDNVSDPFDVGVSFKSSTAPVSVFAPLKRRVAHCV